MLGCFPAEELRFIYEESRRTFQSALQNARQCREAMACHEQAAADAAKAMHSLEVLFGLKGESLAIGELDANRAREALTSFAIQEDV